MFGMYDGEPKYLYEVGFSRKQLKRYFSLCIKDLSEMTEAEKAELKQMYDFANDKKNICAERRLFYKQAGIDFADL